MYPTKHSLQNDQMWGKYEFWKGDKRADPVLLVDMMSQLLQLLISGWRFGRAPPTLQVNGCGQKAVRHHIGVATNG